MGKFMFLSCIWKAVLSPYNIGQRDKIKAFSKILQEKKKKWSLVSVLHKLLGHHKEFKVTNGMQYWQKKGQLIQE